MATAIKETPVLKGREAKRFLLKVKKNEKPSLKHKKSFTRASAVFSAINNNSTV